ncbi:MAG: cold-shock protein [bacterium]
MPVGKVKWFCPVKGYGFLEPLEGGRDIFVHANILRRADIESLDEGETVEFEATLNERTGKLAAVSVRVLP